MLSKVEIKNFQSNRDIVYEFSPGLNVIIAENGTGKSVLNKIIYCMVNYSKLTIEKREQYIRFGCSSAQVKFHSEDYSYLVIFTPRSADYYKIIDGKSVFVGNELPSELRSLLGLLIGEEGFIGNLITSEQSKLLVDSDSRINTQVLGMITTDEQAELIIEGCTERLKVLEANQRLVSKEISARTNMLRSYTYKDVSHKKIVVSNVYKIIPLIDSIESVELILDRYSDVGNLNPNIKEVLDLISNLESLSEGLSKVSTTVVKQIDKKTLDSIKELEDVITKLSYIEDSLKKVTVVKDSKVNRNVLGFMSKLDQIFYNISKVRPVVNLDKSTLDSIGELESMISSLEVLESSITKVNGLISENKKLKDELDSYGGKEYDCPIYGSIKLVNEECIRNYS